MWSVESINAYVPTAFQKAMCSQCPTRQLKEDLDGGVTVGAACNGRVHEPLPPGRNGFSFQILQPPEREAFF
jgi:hypothetical protein